MVCAVLRANLLVVLCCSLGLTACADEPLPGSEGYQLVWSDEFNEDGSPSHENWRHEVGFLRNKEDQWYRPENAWCEGGRLVIEARREHLPVGSLDQNGRIANWASKRTHAEYTSSSLNTKGKHSWLYGRFVMRAKLPAVPGAWPAFWTLGSGRWPACGEIDIMEYYDHSLLANVGWLGKWNKTQWDARKTPLLHFGGEAWSKDFHLFWMDWTEESVEIYVNEQLVNKVDTSSIKNANQAGDNPFQKPHYLLVNLAIGGVHGGDPSATEFPLRYEIDYVRVYQREP